MDQADFHHQAMAYLASLAWSQPRMLAIFLMVPIFNQALLPGMLRLVVATSLGLLVAPVLLPQAQAQVGGMDGARIALLVAKEAFVGLVIGFMLALPFWAFEGIGFLIDNQRGASIASTLNPLTGNDTSPLGILFNQAFIVFVFVSGGFLMLLDVVYDSFRVWSVWDWSPTLRAESMPVFIGLLGRLVRLALLLAAPAVVAMFLAEVGLAMVSRFVPQLQVFFMAMPIKSAVAFLVLVLYMTTLFEYSGAQLAAWRDIVPTLQGQWQTGGAR